MAESKNQPIQTRARVHCPVEDAFRLFTENLAEWWPLASHSLSGDDAESCALEPFAGGRLFERTRSGEERDWGTVTVWDPPHRVAFAWHPGEQYDETQTVEVEFRTDAVGTEVILTHHGWTAQAPQALAAIKNHYSRFVEECILVMA